MIYSEEDFLRTIYNLLFNIKIKLIYKYIIR
jgi:hypothetical protein